MFPPCVCPFFEIFGYRVIFFLRFSFSVNKQYSTILLDPPWPNKSVKRSKSYNTMFQLEDLCDLPIENIISKNGIVIIWLTNNPKVHSFIDELFENWDLKKLVIFHWLKITKNFLPVVNFSNHKIPFESFIIATKKDANLISTKIGLKDDFCFIRYVCLKKKLID